MSATEQGLLHAILESPADDGPRLIYADWLDEQGQAPRAEFIRTQVRLATSPECGHRPPGEGCELELSLPRPAADPARAAPRDCGNNDDESNVDETVRGDA